MAYIGLDRGIRGHWIYQDAEYFKVWFEMLFLARFSKEPHNELVEGEIVEVNYSEFIFGRIKWSERLKISEQRLRTLIKKLKQEKMIEVVLEHRKCTLYRIINYEKFNQQSNQLSDQSQQGKNDYTNQQNNQPSTSSQPAANQQPTTKEESKQRNKVNKVKENKLLYSENVKLTEIEYQRLVNEFGKELTDLSVDFLSSYKIEKDYKTKDDNLTIRRWVIKRVKEDAEKVKGFKSTNKQQPNLQLLQMTDEQRKEYRNDVNKILERNGVSPAVNI